MVDQGFDALPVGITEKEQSFVEAASKSIASEAHPKRNEDSFFYSASGEIVMAGVFDGVGGLARGDEGSRLAREQIYYKLKQMPPHTVAQNAVRYLNQAMGEAGRLVHLRAQITNAEMGTTASVVIICDSGDTPGAKKAVIGNVGDSRVYRLRDGKLEQITLDDGVVRRSIRDEGRARTLQDKFSNFTREEDLTPAELGLYRQRNAITQMLGNPKVTPRITTIDFRDSDRLLLCTDGISDNLTNREIERILKESRDSDSAVAGLTDASRRRSMEGTMRSKPDDITAIAIEGKAARQVGRMPVAGQRRRFNLPWRKNS